MNFVRMFTGLFTLCLVDASLANEWPQWRGPDRDGKATVSGLKLDWNQSPPRHEWTIEGMGKGYASVSVVDGRLYTTGNLPDAQAVICVDLASRQRIWATPLTDGPPQHGYQGSRCTPAIDGDRLYVIGSNGQIACLRTGDGEVVWSKDFRQEWNGKMMSGWGFSESPLVDGDWVLCTPGGREAMVVALNKLTGQEIWRTDVSDLEATGKDGAAYSSIVISYGGGVKQYVQLIGKGLIGVRAHDGELLWNYDKIANRTANIPTPICLDDYVFASTGYGTGACLLKLTRDRDGVRAVEEYFLGSKTFQNHHGGMILDGDYIYAGHQHGRGLPICLKLKTGEVTWIEDNRKLASGSAAITYVNGQLIFRYQDGTLALIEATPEGYQLNGSFTPVYQEGKTWSHPVVVDGKLYLREQDKLMCYGL